MNKLIEKANNILITTHKNPDADGLGCGIAFMEVIESLYPKKSLYFFVDGKPPKNLSFLPHFERIEDINENSFPKNIDLVISLDMPNIQRGGAISKHIKDLPNINIDHHLGNSNFGAINFVDTGASSTAELLVDLFKEYSYEIDDKVANALYAGLIFDTGNFLWAASSKTFDCASLLTKKGANVEMVSKNLFHKNSYTKFKIIEKAIGNMVYDEKKGLLYSYISNKEIKKLDAKQEDFEGVVELLKSFEKAKVTLLMKEDEKSSIRGNIRSDTVDVSRLASLFGGGGHKKASGFQTKKRYMEIVDLIQRES